MATRQTIQARHSLMLYIGLLILGLLPVLAVVLLVVTPEREEHQQLEDDLSEMRATSQAQSTVIVKSQATVEAQATTMTRSQATVEAQATTMTRSQATVEAQATTMTQAQATTTAMTQALRFSEWRTIFFDDFSTNENGWSTGENESELGTINRSISNNKYRWDGKAAKGVVWRSFSDMDPVSDFYLTVEGQQISGAEDGHYGVTFRQDDDNNYYLFTVRDDQHFRFSLWYQNERTTLIDWTETPAIQPNEVNRLTVIAEGSHFLFYINDHLVAEADDSQLSEGEVGLASGLLNAGDEGVFEFDNFEVRVP